MSTYLSPHGYGHLHGHNTTPTLTDKLAAGVYAVHVTGTLPEHVVDDLEASGIHYKAREDME